MSFPFVFPIHETHSFRTLTSHASYRFGFTPQIFMRGIHIVINLKEEFILASLFVETAVIGIANTFMCYTTGWVGKHVLMRAYLTIIKF